MNIPNAGRLADEERGRRTQNRSSEIAVVSRNLVAAQDWLIFYGIHAQNDTLK